jgi:hypothetical protein
VPVNPGKSGLESLFAFRNVTAHGFPELQELRLAENVFALIEARSAVGK